MTGVEVVVVGAGPAGLAAAIEASASGAEVLLIDEGAAVGGQIYRPLASQLASGTGDRLGRDRVKSRPLLDALAEARVTTWSETQAWGVFAGCEVALFRAGGVMRLRAGALVLATGTYDRPVAFPGWTLPGVVTAGGTTALLKAQRLLPGRRVLLAGTGPLLMAAAGGLVHGGAEVVGIAEAGSRAALAGLLRGPGVLGRALQLLGTLRTARVPVWPRHGIVRAEGAEGVERAVIAEWDEDWRPRPGTERTLEVDTVCLGYGLVPSTELAQLAGCAVAYRPGQGGWVPVAEAEALMATSVPGVFVAGDGAGVAGAETAEAQGRLAGLGAARHVGRLDQATAAARGRAPLRRLAALAGFRRSLEQLFSPRPGLAELATEETLVCRCEEVPARDVRAAIEDGARRLTEVRAATRCGMGLCQGRLCAPTVAALIARWARVPPESAGQLTPRAPVRPVPASALAEAAVAEPVPAGRG